MKYNPQIHHRRSIRLKGYDYSQSGVYFVTICTNDRQCWFGEIHNSQMCLNQLGKIVAQGWLRTPEIRPEVILDEWTIMPNHLHGIIIITNKPPVGAHRRAPNQPIPPNDYVGAHRRAPNRRAPNQHAPNQHAPNQHASHQHIRPIKINPNQPQFRRQSKSLASIIAGFKSATTKRINEVRATPKVPLWERNYYESIVRNTEHLEHVRNYIWANPSRWKKDPEYSSSTLINSFDLPF
ncbi:MAG: transposase [Symploca sp. SIO3E6]|nr:transposase [Caldora sp. SIO3E6]